MTTMVQPVRRVPAWTMWVPLGIDLVFTIGTTLIAVFFALLGMSDSCRSGGPSCSDHVPLWAITMLGSQLALLVGTIVLMTWTRVPERQYRVAAWAWLIVPLAIGMIIFTLPIAG